MEHSILCGSESSRVAGGPLPKVVARLEVVASAGRRDIPGSNKSAQLDALARAAGLKRYV